MQALEEADLRAGEDVAVVGAGNIHYGDMLRVPLTTVSWSRVEMGQAAARVLPKIIMGEVSGAKSAERIIVPPEIVVRQSRGAAVE